MGTEVLHAQVNLTVQEVALNTTEHDFLAMVLSCLSCEVSASFGQTLSKCIAAQAAGRAEAWGKATGYQHLPKFNRFVAGRGGTKAETGSHKTA